MFSMLTPGNGKAQAMNDPVMEFFMHMDPPTATYQEKKIAVGKNGKPYLYEPAEVKKARSKLESYLARYRPEVPYDCGVRLITKWLFPDSANKYPPGTYRLSPPDTDNLQKMLKDCMTRCGFWKDDSLVASEITEKFWNGNITGIWIRIEVL